MTPAELTVVPHTPAPVEVRGPLPGFTNVLHVFEEETDEGTQFNVQGFSTHSIQDVRRVAEAVNAEIRRYPDQASVFDMADAHDAIEIANPIVHRDPGDETDSDPDLAADVLAIVDETLEAA